MQRTLKRAASFSLALALMLSLIGSMLQYSLSAGSYGALGTNVTLGSPILSDSFTSDNWNKWEMVVWGIFLSNFTTPFIDDYNTAFNLDATDGSKGSGCKALQFGSGRDPANNKVIESLLNYAINQQVQGSQKPIYVSYTVIENRVITDRPVFNTAGDGISTDSGDSDGSLDGGGDTGGSDDTTQVIREATVRDLFFMNKSDTSTWAFSTADNKWWKCETVLNFENYTDMVGVLNGNIPTFAIKTNGGGYENVLDYTDGYDLSILSAVLARGLGGDFKSEFKSTLEKVLKNPENYKLVLDCFGNICAKIDGSIRIIIPAAANKHLTANPSINLVNSLIFNASVNTAGKEQVILNGGQESGGFLGFVAGELWQSGVPALTNSSSKIPAGSMMLYYDTDTIVYQKATQAGKGTAADPYEVHTGQLYLDLFSLDITNSSSQPYAFKIEPANIDDIDYSGLTGDAEEAVPYTFSIVTQLVNFFNTRPDVEVLTSIKTGASEYMSIFGDAYIVPVQVQNGMKTLGIDWPWRENTTYNAKAIQRKFVNYAYEATQATTQKATGILDRDVVIKAFKDSPNVNTLYYNLLYDVSYQKVSTLFTSFIYDHTAFYKVDSIEDLKVLEYNGPGGFENIFSTSGYQTMLEGKNLNDKNAFSVKDSAVDVSAGAIDDSEVVLNRTPFGRSVKVYTTSETMRLIANVLGVRDGTEFAVWSTNIYLTYLDWYGITSASKLSSISGKENKSKLNERIFEESSDILNAPLDEIAPDVMTEEEKEEAIMDWTYMLLNPTAGREYRSNIIMSGLSDFIYNTYQRIVYGRASSYYDTGSGVTSRTSTGFLTVEPYADNFLTAWLIGNYAYYAVILMGVFMVLIVLAGLINRRKLSWFLVTTLVMVNMLLILPSFGEVLPLMANNFVQDMFSDKMSYWAISEGVTNATLEAEYVSDNTLSSGYMSQLTKDEQQMVVKMVRDLNVLYLDRSICIKQDISKKVNQEAITDYDQLQELRTARWMLPMLMRQFSANDGSANFVYVPLADKYEDLSNLYWFYKPSDAASSLTVNASQVKGDDGRELPVYNTETGYLHQDTMRHLLLHGYTNTTAGYDACEIKYKQKSYDLRPLSANIHTYSYFIEAKNLVADKYAAYSSFSSYDAWASDLTSRLVTKASKENFKAIEKTIEQVGDAYDKFDRGTINQVYGFLWATENPLHFFYEGIKDSFEDGMSLGYIVGELQGTYVYNEGLGKEVHKTFMHAGETGLVRDILDLEEMFTNMIPYLYSIQLAAEGYGNVKGIFEADDMVENYELYKNNPKSWLFRSNWVTKIMENEDLHGDANIKLADGTDVTVANMLIPSEYVKAGRRMVFSEAQMYADGLTEDALSLVELKCIKINKEASKSWIMLLNYASTPGMTKEVYVRQMALDALIIFNAEFSPAGVLNGAYTMYPNGIDLRSISFDSIMKMLMLNVTKNTSYIYGDTMKTLIEDADIFTSILLLITSLACVYVVPLVRNGLLAAVLYLGLWSILWSILRSGKTKAKVACGYIISNILVLAMTFIYFLAFRTIMTMSSSDEVLTITEVQVNTGNPVWCLLLVLLVSICYIAFMCKMIIACYHNWKDMGFEIYAGVADMVTNKIASGIEALGTKISGGVESIAKFGHGIANSTGEMINNAGTFGYGVTRHGNSDDKSNYSGSNSDDILSSSSHMDKPVIAISDDGSGYKDIDAKIKSGAKKGKKSSSEGDSD